MLKHTLFFQDINDKRITETLNLWQQKYPQGGVFSMVPERNSTHSVTLLQKQANYINYPLIGAVFPQLIINSEFKNQGVTLLCFQFMPLYSLTTLSGYDENPEQTTQNIIQPLSIDYAKANQSLFFIFDALIPNISSIMDQLYLQVGDHLHYMGGNAGSETFTPINCLFDNHNFVKNAVLSMLILDHPGAGLEHGYSMPDITILATSTKNNRINSIDWRPAFDVYKELAFKYYGIDINENNFYEYGVHFPFGIMRMDGEILVRVPVGLDSDGAIYCVGEIPENSLITLLQGVKPDSPKTIQKLVDSCALMSAASLLFFYCAGRRLHLQEATKHELMLLSENMPEKTIVGALTLGEIAGSKQSGYPLFHNAALVAIPWK